MAVIHVAFFLFLQFNQSIDRKKGFYAAADQKNLATGSKILYLTELK